MKKIFRSLFLALLATASSALAATAPATNAPPAAPAPPPAKAAAPAPAPAASILDDYITELTATLKLTDDEKKKITGYYLDDGATLKAILNNDALSPVQKAGQVSGLRDTRNAKIERLLQDVDRQHAFFPIEARYRVALTEFAADGGLAPAEPALAAPPAPAPTSVAK
jgi:hypothetical protein